MNRDKERDMFKDLLRGEPNHRSIPANPHGHYVYLESGVYDLRCNENSVCNQSFYKNIIKLFVFFSENFLKKTLIR